MKKYTNILITLLTLYISINLIINPNIQETIKKINIIYLNTLFINLIPFYITIDILINYNITKYIEKIIKKPYIKLLKEPKNTIYIFIISILTGPVSASKFINQSLNNKEINTNSATHLLTYTNFTNPIFIIEMSKKLLTKKIGYLIIITQYTLNIITGIIFKNNKTKEEIKIIPKAQKPFIEILKESTIKNINILTIIYGIFLISNITSSLLFKNLPNNLKIILTSLIEITNGLNLLQNIKLPINILSSIVTFILTFSGLSIHLQIFSIINNKKIKYSTYLKSRIFHSIISSIIIYIITSSLY